MIAQEKQGVFGAGVTQHFGFISPHNVLVNEVIKGHSHITELSFYQQTTGEKQWERFFNYPKMGISAVFINSGNPESLGNIYGLFPYVDFPLNHWKITWNLKFGYGIGFVEKPFNRETNYKNLAIGSNINALIFVNSHWDFPVTEKLSLSTGVSLTHLSNGSLKRPNSGINIFSMNAGLSYYFGNPIVKDKGTDERREKDLIHAALVTVGLKEIDPIGGHKFMVYNASYNLLKVVTNKSSVGVGLDFSYNSSLESLTIRLQNEDRGKNSNFNAGISGIYSMDMGKVSLMFQTGGYLYRIYTQDRVVYTRIGTRYRFTDKLFFNLSLKTHFFVADFIEYGIGYRFK
jgi:hypothetical protein